MPEQRILELEQLLLTANELAVKLNTSITELTSQLTGAELRNRKLKRSFRKNESNLKEQLLIAQTRRS